MHIELFYAGIATDLTMLPPGKLHNYLFVISVARTKTDILQQYTMFLNCNGALISFQVILLNVSNASVLL